MVFMTLTNYLNVISIRKYLYQLLLKQNSKQAMIAMDRTIAGAASGETVEFHGAEGFTISGKRTEEY